MNYFLSPLHAQTVVNRVFGVASAKKAGFTRVASWHQQDKAAPQVLISACVWPPSYSWSTQCVLWSPKSIVVVRRLFFRWTFYLCVGVVCVFFATVFVACFQSFQIVIFSYPEPLDNCLEQKEFQNRNRRRRIDYMWPTMCQDHSRSSHSFLSRSSIAIRGQIGGVMYHPPPLVPSKDAK